MKKLKHLILGIVIIIIASPAYAYIDPGSGSLLLQFIIAGLVGLFFKFRIFIVNILTRIKQKFKR
jgi:hypothetical protein